MDPLAFMGLLAIILGVIGVGVLLAGGKKKNKG